MSGSVKKVGIYSGVFDPIHNGHISFARKAAHELGLDRVFFMAEPRPRRKHDSSDLKHRLAMVKLALKDHKELGLLSLDHPQFDIHLTLPWLEQKFADTELHLLMGTDLFGFIHTWPDFDLLQDRMKLVVGQREGESSAASAIAHQGVVAELGGLSSTQVRAAHTNDLPTLVPQPVAQYIVTHQLYK